MATIHNIQKLCLGTMMFGGPTNEIQSQEVLEIYADAGGRFIDTADQYTEGRSETIVGRLLAGRREDFFLATKVGNPMAGIEASGGLSATWIEKAIGHSLKRLNTDYIDLYYLHLEDNSVPLEESIEAIGKLLNDGKIRLWGISNFRSWKIAEIMRLCDALGIVRPTYAQPYYHMLNRTAESDFLPACAYFDMKVVSYSPLARGVLTGKYSGGNAPEGSRGARGDQRITEVEMMPETLAAAERAYEFATDSGKSLADMAVQWVLANRAISTILAGPRTAAQMQGYIDALSTPYSPADEEFYSSLCNPGQLATPSHFDPRYPLDGRKTNFQETAP